MSVLGTFKEIFSKTELSGLEHKPFEFLKSDVKIFAFLKKHWYFNFQQFGFGHLIEEMFEVINRSDPSKTEKIIEEINKVFSNSEFKRYARKSRRQPSRMEFNYDLVKEYLDGVESLLDFGGGKMALLRRICKENKEIKKLYGYDPKSNPDFVDFDPRFEFITEINRLKELKDIDLIYSSFVFHHLTEQEINEAFKLIHKIMKPGGKFIFLEESFYKTRNWKLETGENKLIEIGYEMNLELVKEFEKMEPKEKFLAIYLNDVLINLKNLHYMPWTFEYRTIEEWRRIAESFGLKVEEEYFWGIVKNKKLKQGFTGYLLFSK